MPAFAPSLLASWTGGHWTTRPALPLRGFTQDTRKLRAGQVFVALKTDKRDGHEFLPQAVATGASAALVSRAFPELAFPQLVVPDPLAAFQIIAREHRRSFQGRVAAITGSCGKTSTKNLLALLLGGEPLVLATEGNLNNHLGVPLTLTRLEPSGHESAVIEAGISAPGDMALLADMIQPDFGIVTLIAPAHTEELGGLEGVAREKAVLLRRLRPSGLGVFPKQCWDFAAFRDLPQTSIVAVPEGESVQAPRIVRFGLKWSPTSTEVLIGRRRFDFRRVTRGMAQNAVLAIILASEVGISDEAIQRALDDWQPTKWRGELRQDGQRTLYLDFYNANPASMADSLENFLALVPADEPRLFVLGCMEELGREAPRYHRELGRALPLRPQDRAFVIGTEAEAVRAGALDAGTPADRIEVVTTLAPVVSSLAQFRGAVFVKGSRRYELEKVVPSAPAEKPVPPGTGPLPPSAGGSGGGSIVSQQHCTWARPPAAVPLSWQFPRAATAGRGSVYFG